MHDSKKLTKVWNRQSRRF